MPAVDFQAVTPSDSDDLAPSARALYVGFGGDVAVLNSRGDAVTFVGVVTGTVLPIQTKRVLETGTSADSIVALF